MELRGWLETSSLEYLLTTRVSHPDGTLKDTSTLFFSLLLTTTYQTLRKSFTDRGRGDSEMIDLELVPLDLFNSTHAMIFPVSDTS